MSFVLCAFICHVDHLGNVSGDRYKKPIPKKEIKKHPSFLEHWIKELISKVY